MSLNGRSNCEKLSQYQTELLFGSFLQSYMLMSNFIPTTISTDLYLTLNPLATRSEAHRDPAALPDLCEVNLAIGPTAALSTQFSFADFDPSTGVATLHITIHLPQVYTS